MSGLTLLLVLSSAAVAADRAEVRIVSGRAEVIDGDSLRIGQEEIRLQGIDAPEALQRCQRHGRSWPCGRAASETLAAIVRGADLHCEWTERDAYDRMLGTCFDSSGVDINARMVGTGMALAYRRYSARYSEPERRAQDAERGLWAGSFTPPWQWRREQPRAPSDCTVKGNVNRRGARIYHDTHSPAYEQVRINLSEGDRCFSSIAEAEAAGFRAPRQ